MEVSADQHKDQGNAAFKAKDYEEAIRQYTAAIEMTKDTPNHIFYANRANAYLFSEKYEACIEDCKTAIGIEPSFIKSYYRMSKAFLGMGVVVGAFRAAKLGLRVDPNHEELKLIDAQCMKIMQDEKAAKESKKTPITILTGFLGSGKTTLLNRILSEPHGKKIAVIENEFGAEGIDQKLVADYKHDSETIVEIMNGCVCCTVREDLATTLMEMKAKYIDTGKIDYIILETTGMADPAPVIQTFYAKPEVQECMYVDACITVCDVTQIKERLCEDREEGCENEAVEQVCFSDKVLLNKMDLATPEMADEATEKIREFNTQCPIERVQINNAEIPFGQLLDQRMFSIERALEIDDELLGEDQEHKHDSRIGTFSYKMETEMDLKGANTFIGTLLREKGADIYRMKGFLALEGQPMKYVFHSVGMIFNIQPLQEWKEGEKRQCVFVIIGKNLSQQWLEDKFKAAAVNNFMEIENEQLKKYYPTKPENQKQE